MHLRGISHVHAFPGVAMRAFTNELPWFVLDDMPRLPLALALVVHLTLILFGSAQERQNFVRTG